MVFRKSVNESLLFIASVTLLLIALGAHNGFEQATGLIGYGAVPPLVLICYLPFLGYEYVDNCRDRWGWKPTGHWFEWSHYGATLSVIIIKICMFVGWKYVTFAPLLLAGLLAHLLPFFSLNIGTRRKTWKIKNRSIITIPDVLIAITYFVTLGYAVYTFPMTPPTFIPECAECAECLNPWVCHVDMDARGKRGTRGWMMCIVLLSTSLYYKTYKVFTATELILETLDPETKRMRKQVLVRRGWIWEPKNRQNLELEDADKKND